jgi:hypothetical protein
MCDVYSSSVINFSSFSPSLVRRRLAKEAPKKGTSKTTASCAASQLTVFDYARQVGGNHEDG